MNFTHLFIINSMLILKNHVLKQIEWKLVCLNNYGNGISATYEVELLNYIYMGVSRKKCHYKDHSKNFFQKIIKTLYPRIYIASFILVTTEVQLLALTSFQQIKAI